MTAYLLLLIEVTLVHDLFERVFSHDVEAFLAARRGNRGGGCSYRSVYRQIPLEAGHDTHTLTSLRCVATYCKLASLAVSSEHRLLFFLAY